VPSDIEKKELRYQIIDNFLTPEECNQLIEMSLPKLERAGSWDFETASNQYTDYRICQQMFFHLGANDMVKSIEQKIEKLTHYPIVNGEGMQVLRYGIGGHFKVHCDWFDPRYTGNEPVLRTGGQRVATVIMYLNDVKAGGETFFPKINLRVRPKQASALFWWNVDEQGNPDINTLHSGEDVLEGEKWIMTKWIREREYR
jgi:prolyl 4-hydroxylase